jgi:hypothetical protein
LESRKKGLLFGLTGVILILFARKTKGRGNIMSAAIVGLVIGLASFAALVGLGFLVVKLITPKDS